MSTIVNSVYYKKNRLPKQTRRKAGSFQELTTPRPNMIRTASKDAESWLQKTPTDAEINSAWRTLKGQRAKK